jgi:hypothetical protein
MSLWEFAAVLEGYRKANSSDEDPLVPPTAEEFRAMVEARARSLH